jgi:hypothetical protein
MSNSDISLSDHEDAIQEFLETTAEEQSDDPPGMVWQIGGEKYDVHVDRLLSGGRTDG